jgi:hypothetical protein
MQTAVLSPEHSAYRPVMQGAYRQKMANDSPRQIRRRENLRRLVDENGGQAQVAVEVGTPKSHFSAILAGRRGLGDGLAAKLERHYQKPPGWMDAELTDQTALPDEVGALAAEVAALPPELRERVLIMWRGALGLANKTLNADAVGETPEANSLTDVRHPTRKAL